MHRPIRILHCADLHLGSDFATWPPALAKQRKRELLNTFREITALCRTEEIDLLLIAGDLFEGANIDRQIILAVKQSLASLPQTLVAIAPGNHDYMAIDSPYADDDWPQHVIIFRGAYETRLFPEMGLALSGAAFRGTYCQTSMLADVQAQATDAADRSSVTDLSDKSSSASYPAASPSDSYDPVTDPSSSGFSATGRSSATHADFIRIGVIHGDLVSKGGSSLYNPISDSEIAATSLDYLALGHTHQKTDILRAGETYYAYSGCPEGRGFDETGEKGVYIGTVDRYQAKLLFRSLSRRRYLIERVDVSELETEDAIVKEITSQLYSKHGKQMEQNLYKITMTGSLPADFSLDKAALEDNLSQIFYFIKLVDQTTIKSDYAALAEEETLKGLFTARLLKAMRETKQQTNHLQAKQADQVPQADQSSGYTTGQVADDSDGSDDLEDGSVFEEALKIGLQAFESEVWLDED